MPTQSHKHKYQTRDIPDSILTFQLSTEVYPHLIILQTLPAQQPYYQLDEGHKGRILKVHYRGPYIHAR